MRTTLAAFVFFVLLASLPIACGTRTPSPDPALMAALERAKVSEAARQDAEANTQLLRIDVSRVRADNEELRKELADARRKQEAAETELAKVTGKGRSEAEEKAATEAATRAIADTYKEGDTYYLRGLDCKIVAVNDLPPDKFQRYASVLLKTGKGAFLMVSGVSPNGLQVGGSWEPERDAVFTAIKPQRLPSLDVAIPHLAQDPTTRASFPKKP